MIEDKTLIFMHVPKAAGSTLVEVLLRHYDPSQVYWIKSPASEIADEFSQLPLNQRKNIKLLIGHMPFGLHSLLPQKTTYITFLRDPVDRTLSYYSYVLENPDNEHHDEVVQNNMSFGDYLKSGLLADNGQTRWLAGINADEPCTSATLATALRNIQQYFPLVGLTEYFNETLLILRGLFGWSIPLYVRRNVTRKRLRREDISENTYMLLLEQVVFDLALHRYVKGLLETRIRNQGGLFQMELRGFAILNRFYSSLALLPKPIRQFAKQILQRN